MGQLCWIDGSEKIEKVGDTWNKTRFNVSFVVQKVIHLLRRLYEENDVVIFSSFYSIFVTDGWKMDSQIFKSFTICPNPFLKTPKYNHRLLGASIWWFFTKLNDASVERGSTISGSNVHTPINNDKNLVLSTKIPTSLSGLDKISKSIWQFTEGKIKMFTKVL